MKIYTGFNAYAAASVVTSMRTDTNDILTIYRLFKAAPSPRDTRDDCDAVLVSRTKAFCFRILLFI